MHRMASGLSILLFASLAHASAADTAALPDENLSDDGESRASVNAMPSIIGDRESQRRSWIKQAWRARDAKPRRLDDVEAALRAADHLRSSTFTRCNLALVAEERGDRVGAAEYFQRELETPLPSDATERVRFIRHVCEMSAALALERVGKLQIVAPERSAVWIDRYWVGSAPLSSVVFVKPDEEHVVRVELRGDRELQKMVSVRAGRTTTLEFQSPEDGEKEEPPKEMLAPKPLTLPLIKYKPSDAPASKAGWGWKEAVGISGATLMVVGAAAMVGAYVWEGDIEDAQNVRKNNTEWTCTDRGTTFGVECHELNVKHNIANQLGRIGLGITMAGAAGMGVYLISALPSSSPSPAGQGKNLGLGTLGIGMRGIW